MRSREPTTPVPCRCRPLRSRSQVPRLARPTAGRAGRRRAAHPDHGRRIRDQSRERAFSSPTRSARHCRENRDQHRLERRGRGGGRGRDPRRARVDQGLTAEDVLSTYRRTRTRWRDGREIVVLTRPPGDSSLDVLNREVPGFKAGARGEPAADDVVAARRRQRQLRRGRQQLHHQAGEFRRLHGEDHVVTGRRRYSRPPRTRRRSAGTPRPSPRRAAPTLAGSPPVRPETRCTRSTSGRRPLPRSARGQVGEAWLTVYPRAARRSDR